MAKLLFLQELEYEFLGPMYLSALLKANSHETRMAIGRDADDFSGIMEEYKPDLVAFSVMTGSHRWAQRAAAKLKKKYNALTVFGGPHPTFFPEFINEDGVDIICRGEGEEALLDLMNALRDGRDFTRVPNLHIKKDGTVIKNEVRALCSDIDLLPLADRNLYDCLDSVTERSVRNVITSRGCPFHCTFCFEDSMRELYKDKGKYVRIRRVDNVMAELAELKKTHGARAVYFCDDVFGIDKKWLYEFLPIYKKEIGLEFFCLVRADVVASDETYAVKLKEAGCSGVFFGIETGSEALRNGLLNKNLRDKDIYKAAAILRKAGLKFRTYNILGLPGETLDDAFATVEMNIKLKADYPWCSIFSPYPRTKLTEYACARGYLEKDFQPDSVSRSFFIESRLNMPDAKRIENLQKFFQTAVLWPWLLPAIKLLIKLPPNIFFRGWFALVYFYVYLKSERRGFLKTLIFALRNYKHVIIKG